MMAGVELDRCASGHEMSNQQPEKQSFPNTILGRLGKTARYLQLRSFTFFALRDLYPGSCAKVVILKQLPFF